MNYRAVIFDFDDTLVKTKETKWRQHKIVAKRFYGIDLTDEELRLHWGKPYDETLRLFYKNADTIENMRAAKLSLEHLFPLEAAEGAISLVQTLAKARVAVGVLSSSLQSLVIADLKRLGFPMGALCVIQGSEDTNAHKPNPLVFKPTLDALARQDITSGIIYVGDSINDYRAAQGAGLDFLGVTSGLTTMRDFKAEGTTVVGNLSKIPDKLDLGSKK